MNVEEAVRAAITAVDSFLEQTAHCSRAVTPQHLRALSERIEQARGIRVHQWGACESSDLQPLRELYRMKLEQLRERLSETACELKAESDRVADENERINCVRKWHEQFTATH